MSFTITNITQATNAVVTVSTVGSQPFSTGNLLQFAAVVGMTQINGVNGTCVAVGGTSGAFTATVNINSTTFSAYSSGGTVTILTGVPISGLPVASTLTGAEIGPVDQGTSTVKTALFNITAQFVAAAETAASATPAFYTYRVTPHIDPRRYGAVGNGTTDDTTAMQTALNVAKAGNGHIVIPENFNMLCQPLALTFSGNRTNESIVIEGASPNGSRITAKNASNSLLNMTGSTPTAAPQEAPLIIENISLQGFSTAASLLTLVGLGFFQIRGVFFGGSFNAGIGCFSALTGIIDQGCSFDGGIFGVYARMNGAGSSANLLRIRNNVFGGTSSYAVDYDQGSELQMDSNDIEECTGAIHTGPNVNCAPSFGFGKVVLQNNWIEACGSGAGNFVIQVDAPTAGQQTNITIRGGHVVNSTSGRAIGVAGATRLLIEDCYSPSPGDTWLLTATNAVLTNCLVSTLMDSGVTHPTYTNVTTSTGSSIYGQLSSFTTTLTGCTTAPVGTQEINIQGNAVQLFIITPITATYSSGAVTLTGLPSRYWPANDTSGVLIAINNGQAQAVPCTVAGATGIISLALPSPTGTVGIDGGTLLYRIV